MEAASTGAMEPPAASVKAVAATICITAATEVAAAPIGVAAVEVSTTIAAAVSTAIPAIISAPIVVAAATVISAAITISAPIEAAAVAVDPRAGSDEDAADKPVRAVVSIRSAVIRRIIVVAVSADGRSAIVARGTDSDAECYALGLRVGRREKRDGETNTD
jgi:hypothetical protein